MQRLILGLIHSDKFRQLLLSPTLLEAPTLTCKTLCRTISKYCTNCCLVIDVEMPSHEHHETTQLHKARNRRPSKQAGHQMVGARRCAACACSRTGSTGEPGNALPAPHLASWVQQHGGNNNMMPGLSLLTEHTSTQGRVLVSVKEGDTGMDSGTYTWHAHQYCIY